MYPKAALLLAVAGLFAIVPVVVPPFEGFRPDQFPIPQDRPAVQPAGYAFAIWGLIYIWLFIGAGFGLLKRATDPDWQSMRAPLILSLAIGCAWLPVARISVLGATALIWLMLATALVALFRTGDTDRWVQQAPVAIYAGWLTAASAVAIGLVAAGFGVLSETPAALLALAIALTVTLLVQYRLHRAPEYGMTVIWALIAIIVANSQPLNIAVAGLAGLGILAILSLRGTDTE